MSSTTYLRRRTAAEYLRENRGIPTSEKTLAKLACIGGGPVYRLFGRIPLYTSPDLDAYADAKLGKVGPLDLRVPEAMIMRSSGAKTPRFFHARMQVADGRGEWVLLKSARLFGPVFV